MLSKNTRAATVAGLLLGALSAALAQPSSQPKPAPSLSYQSAFDGYRRFADQPVQPWRESNETVARVGGWKTYARESAGADAAATSAMPASASEQAVHGGHVGHKSP